jgi:hypothetical protein
MATTTTRKKKKTRSATVSRRRSFPPATVKVKAKRVPKKWTVVVSVFPFEKKGIVKNMAFQCAGGSVFFAFDSLMQQFSLQITTPSFGSNVETEDEELSKSILTLKSELKKAGIDVPSSKNIKSVEVKSSEPVDWNEWFEHDVDIQPWVVGPAVAKKVATKKNILALVDRFF